MAISFSRENRLILAQAVSGVEKYRHQAALFALGPEQLVHQGRRRHIQRPVQLTGFGIAIIPSHSTPTVP